MPSFKSPLKKFVFLFCLMVFSKVGFAEPFQITLSANGDSRSYTYDNVEDLIDAVSNRELDELLPSYTPTSAATATVNLRGLPATLTYPGAGTTLVLDVPSIGLTRTFNGATRDDSQELLEDFFQGQDGSDALTQILQELASSTPLDPVAGNPNSLLSRMGDADFARGTDYREGFQVSAYQDNKNDFGVGVDTGWFSNDISDQSVTTATLSYARHLSDHNASILLDMPVTYIDTDGGEGYSASLGLGVRMPVNSQWALTPIARVGALGSPDLGAAAIIYSGSVVSDFRVPLSTNNEFQLGNMVGYAKTVGVTIGDYNIDYDLANVRFKNGVALNHSFTQFSTPVTGRVYFNDSRFTGDSLFNNNYEEVVLSLIKPYTSIVSAQLGVSYLFADEYDGVRLNFDLHF